MFENDPHPVLDARESTALSAMGMTKELITSNTYVSNSVPMRWYSGSSIFSQTGRAISTDKSKEQFYQNGVARHKNIFRLIATELSLGFSNGWKNTHPKIIEQFIEDPFLLRWDYLKKTFGAAL